MEQQREALALSAELLDELSAVADSVSLSCVLGSTLHTLQTRGAEDPHLEGGQVSLFEPDLLCSDPDSGELLTIPRLIFTLLGRAAGGGAGGAGEGNSSAVKRCGPHIAISPAMLRSSNGQRRTRRSGAA